MTVRELIAHLSRCANPDALVVLQKDGEGNGYSPMRGDDGYDPAHVEQYVAETTWYGEVHPAEEDAGGVSCVVLAPIN